MNDLDLLRKYEPIARLTKGEAFFPIAVDEYVKGCSLWLTNPEGKDRMLIPHGELDVERLVDFDAIPPDHTMHLRFVDQPLEGCRVAPDAPWIQNNGATAGREQGAVGQCTSQGAQQAFAV